MFKDELIAIQQTIKPTRDILHTVAEFKEAIKACVKNGASKSDSKVSFLIIGGKIECKNPLYNEPTCFIEELPAVEKIFRKDEIYMDWHYDMADLNGTLTFRW